MPILEWKHYIDGIDEVEGLSGLERHQAKEALAYLQSVLGDDFLSRACANVPYPAHHPMLGLLLNLAPWTRREVTRIAEYLRTLEGSENLGKVLARLGDADQFQHDLLVIKSAAKLSGDGFRACFQPTMPVRDNQKQPDVRFADRLTGETLFLEVAIQATAQRDQEALQASWAVSNSLMGIGFDLRWAGYLHKTLSEPHLRDILEKISNCAGRAVNGRTLVSIHEEDTIEMAFCHSEKASLLDEWCKERGMRPGEFSGPPLSSDHVERLKQKIRKEQVQLPRDQANGILILDTDMFLRTRDLRMLISEVEEEVYKYPHVPIVIVHGEHLGGYVPTILQKEEHRYTRRDVDGMMTEDNLLLLNRYSPVKLSANLLAKFYRAF